MSSVPTMPINLRNKIHAALTNWEQLGCTVIKGNRFFLPKNDRHYGKIYLFIFGVARDGRAILIWPLARSRTMPRKAAELMRDFQEKGALVGCADSIGDAHDIVINSPEFKRKARTYTFLNILEIYDRRRSRGRPQEEE